MAWAHIAAGLVVAALVAGPCHAVPNRIRADLVGAVAVPTIGYDRHGDTYGHVDLEQELPLYGPFSVGVRGSPVFVYRAANGDVLTGLSFGIVNRVYWHGADLTGAFAGIGVSTLWSRTALAGNPARLNFVSQASFGYQSPIPPLPARALSWHVAVSLEHISNAYTVEPNHGVNGLALSVGLTL